MIHRCQNTTFVAIEPNLVFLTEEGSPSFKYVLWKAGNLATPVRLASTAISNASGIDDYLADTELNGAGTQILYCRVRPGLNPNQSLIRKVAWDDSTNVLLYTDTGDHDAFGNSFSLQPTWRPDGGEVLFRAKGSGTTLNVLKVMAPDGTGVTTIYTEGSGDRVQDPLYNHDGTLIAWMEAFGARLRVANADGSSATTVHSETAPAFMGSFGWAQDSNVIAFQRADDSTYSTTDWSWKKINADGTGLTTLLAINRSTGYGASDQDPQPWIWCWLPDGSAVVTTIQDVGTAGHPHYLTRIFSDGSGKTDYAQTVPSATPDFRPAVFRGGGRIYFADADPATQLSSLKIDGSDYRTDFTGTGVGPSGSNVRFHGFKGDTINV